jgi:pimeloyl-ACP methyl ester carboxylesterase
LSTVPLKLPATARTPPYWASVFWFHNNVLGTAATNWFWYGFLQSIYADPVKVTDDLVTRYRVLNSLPGQEDAHRLRIKTWYSDGGAERDFATAARVTVPILVQWGVAGPVLPEDIQCEITTAFINAEVRVISYPNLGHKLVMEDPRTTAQDAARFLIEGTGGGTCQPQSPKARALAN